MLTKYLTGDKIEVGLFEFLSDFVVVNRLSETFGYNVIYFVIGIGLATTSNASIIFAEYVGVLLITFLAVMFTKMQASVADAVHDYHVDKENPEKSFIASAVDSIGVQSLFTILITELCIGIGLWGWLSLRMNAPVLLWIGVGSCLLGFMYSYPPRIKEKGIFNHIVTTGVDVLGVVLPVTLILDAELTPGLTISLTVVFLYAFGYHVVHQAADTVYDRESGVSTFTRTVGISESIWLASMLTALAGGIAFWQSYYVSGMGLLVAGGMYATLAIAISGQQPREKCNQIARWFQIGPWATGINGLFALSLYL